MLGIPLQESRGHNVRQMQRDLVRLDAHTRAVEGPCLKHFVLKINLNNNTKRHTLRLRVPKFNQVADSGGRISACVADSALVAGRGERRGREQQRLE